MVKAINGTSPGPASGITYDIAFNTPRGSRVALGVVPSHTRPPDVVNTVAAALGSACVVQEVSGNMRFVILGEFPEFGVCPP